MHSKVLALFAVLTVAVAALVFAPAVTPLFGTPPIVRPLPAVPPVAGLHALVQELRGATTVVWQAPADQPDRRSVVATLAHADGFGPRIALSPDGTRLAVTLLPPDGVSPENDARLLLVDITTGQMTAMQDGVDLRGAPVWRADGGAVAVRRWQGDEPEIAVVSLDGVVEAAAKWPGGLQVSAVGWDSAGRLLAAAMLPTGVDLVAPLHAEIVAHLSNGAARDVRLSPDGSKLMYLTELRQDGAALHRLNLGASPNGATGEPLADRVFGAVWRQDGGGLSLSAPAPGARLRSLHFGADFTDWPALGSTMHELDIPVAAGPDGWLAFRRLAGPNPMEPRSESLWIAGPDTQHQLTRDGVVEFVGWRRLR